MITFVCNLMLVVFLMQSVPRTDTEDPVFGVIEGLWKISDQKLLVIREGTAINRSTSGLYVLFTDKAVFTFSKQADRFYFATIDRIYARDESKDGYVLLTRNHSNERRARTRLKVLNDSRELDFFSRWSVDQTGFEMRMTLYKIALNEDTEIIARILDDCRFLTDESAREIVETFLEDRKSENNVRNTESPSAPSSR